MKILISSNSPLTGTGYGTQSLAMGHMFMYLGHQVDYMGWYGLQGCVLDTGKFKIYPRIAHPWGADAGLLVDILKPDLLITFQDIWVLPSNFGEGINCDWAPYFPVDSAPLPEAIIRRLEGAQYPVVYSRFAAGLMEQAGIDHDYIPHAIDTNLYVPRNKQEVRQANNIPEDAFVVSIVAANKGYPSRKSFYELFEGFHRFWREYPDAHLYVHSQVRTADAIPLDDVAQAVGLDKRAVHYCDQDRMRAHMYDSKYIAEVHAASDVALLATRGEGFGLPILEAQACGTPVITQDCSSMPELTVNGEIIPRGMPDLTPLGTLHYIPDPEDIARALERAYRLQKEHPVEWDLKRKAGIKFVHDNYSLPVVAESWDRFLTRVAGKEEVLEAASD